MLAGRLAGGSSFVLPAGEADKKLLHLCSSIIQNISLHPQNRTRLYKAELAGSVALDKLIEDATEALEHDETLREMTGMLPPIILLGGGRGGGSPERRRTTLGAPVASAAPTMAGTGTLRKTAANRYSRISPNGALLNSSVDTATATTMRPKVRQSVSSLRHPPVPF